MSTQTYEGAPKIFCFCSISCLLIIFQHGLLWHQHTLTSIASVSLSLQDKRLNLAPLKDNNILHDVIVAVKFFHRRSDISCEINSNQQMLSLVLVVQHLNSKPKLRPFHSHTICFPNQPFVYFLGNHQILTQCLSKYKILSFSFLVFVDNLWIGSG